MKNMEHKIFLDPGHLCYWCNHEDIKVISVTFVPKGGWCVFYHKKQKQKKNGKLISLDKACKWLEENLAKETGFLYSGVVHVDFNNALRKFKEAMKKG